MVNECQNVIYKLYQNSVTNKNKGTAYKNQNGDFLISIPHAIIRLGGNGGGICEKLFFLSPPELEALGPIHHNHPNQVNGESNLLVGGIKHDCVSAEMDCMGEELLSCSCSCSCSFVMVVVDVDAAEKEEDNEKGGGEVVEIAREEEKKAD